MGCGFYYAFVEALSRGFFEFGGWLKMRRVLVASVILVVVMLGGCSGGGSSGAPPTLDWGTIVPVVVDSVVVDSVAVSAVPLLVPATTPPAATVAPTTTEAATSTTVLDVEAQVKADYLAGFAARRQCDFIPESCDYAAIAVPGSRQDDFTRSTMKTRLDGNLRAVEGKGSYQTRVESVVVGGDVAFVFVCDYDAGIVFDVGDPANPSDDVVFDDSVLSARVKWELHRSGDGWAKFDGVNLETRSGGDLCGF